MKIDILPDRVKQGFLGLITPIVNFFIHLEMNPNWFTTIGFIISIIASFFYGAGYLRWAGVLILLAGVFDIIDGRVARSTNRVTKFGALYDSTLDRYSEVIMFFGLAYFFISEALLGTSNVYLAIFSSVAVSVALGGSVMVSYVRARAEALGFECNVGIMQRPERIVLIGIGSLFHKYILIFVLVVVAVLANFTALQRLYHIWKKENGRKDDPVTEQPSQDSAL